MSDNQLHTGKNSSDSNPPSSREKRKRRRLVRNRMILAGCLVLAVCFAGAALIYSKHHTPPISVQSADSSETVTDTVDSTTTDDTEVTQTTPIYAGTSQSSTPPSNITANPTTASPLWIKVTIDKQNVTVYDAKNRVVESFVCSTGLPGDDTPKGTYKIQERGYSFFSKTYQEGAYYWTQFSGDFLFHSVPFDKDRNIETAEAAKLGNKASHGCVRLSIDNAKWIYDNIPRGTKVVIE